MAWETTWTLHPELEEGDYIPLVSLLPYEVAHVQVERTDAGTTDSFKVFAEASIDNGVTVDTEPLVEFEIEPSPSADVVSFFVMGPPFFRVGMTKVGSTDTITVKVRTRKNGGIAA